MLRTMQSVLLAELGDQKCNEILHLQNAGFNKQNSDNIQIRERHRQYLLRGTIRKDVLSSGSARLTRLGRRQN